MTPALPSMLGEYHPVMAPRLQVTFVRWAESPIHRARECKKRVCGPRTHRHCAIRTAALSKPGQPHRQRERVSAASFQRDGFLVAPWGVRHQPRAREALCCVILSAAQSLLQANYPLISAELREHHPRALVAWQIRRHRWID